MIHIKEVLNKLTRRLNIKKETQTYEVSFFLDKILKSFSKKKLAFKVLGIREKTLILKIPQLGLKNEIYLKKEKLLETINNKLNLSLKDIKFKN